MIIANTKREIRIARMLMQRAKRVVNPVNVALWWWNTAIVLLLIAVTGSCLELVLLALCNAAAATNYRLKVEENENN